MNNIEHVCQCVMTVPRDFGISEDRASTSSTSSINDTTTPALDSFDHLLEFVITTVDQIDLAIYSALEPISQKVCYPISHRVWEHHGEMTVMYKKFSTCIRVGVPL